jgi:hypothetical protein
VRVPQQNSGTLDIRVNEVDIVMKAWRHPVLEGVAVLAGILIAFSIDAAWDERQDRVQAKAHLSAILDELDAAEEGFRAQLDYLNEENRLIAALLDHAEDYSGADASVDSLIFLLGPYVDYSPPMVAFDDLEGAGGLSLIDVPEVRRGIARYRGAVAADAAEQATFVDYWLREVMPYWDEVLNIRRFIDYSSLVPDGDLMPQDLAPVSLDPNYRTVLRDRRFLNQLSTRIIKTWRVRRFHLDVLDEIEVLRGVIREHYELGGSDI